MLVYFTDDKNNKTIMSFKFIVFIFKDSCTKPQIMYTLTSLKINKQKMNKTWKSSENKESVY